MREHKKAVALAALFIACAFLILLARAFQLQVLRGESFERFARQNRIRLEKKPAPRGNIYDRNGEKITASRPSFNLKIFPTETADDPKIIAERLSQILQIPREILEKRILRAHRGKSLSGSVIIADIDRDSLARFEARKNLLAGLDIEVGYLRRYPFGNSAAHILGHTSKASPADLARFGALGPQGIVGKSGIERKYETVLRGKSGAEQTVRDALGRKVGTEGLLGGEMRSRPAAAGGDVFLTLDIGLQQTAERLLGGRKGAVVVMDVNSGEVLALASSPSFSPPKLTGRVEPKYWKSLIENADSPMLNRALAGTYAPGSVFKIVTAAALLTEKTASPEVEVNCPGQMRIGRRAFRCWKRKGHKKVGLLRALAESCDVYFYRMSQLLGVNAIQKYSGLFGFGRRTGFGFGEKKGVNPGRAWKRAKYGTAWQKGETAILAIGQSYLNVTPVQVAVMTAAVANGGRILTPFIVSKTVSPEGVAFPEKNRQARDLEISEQTLEFLRRSMEETVLSGTGRLAKNSVISIAGKTGTAQTVSTSAGEKTAMEPHAWFAAFAPAASPKAAVAVVVENGGAGSVVAVPIVREIFAAYFENAQKSRELPAGSSTGGEISSNAGGI